MKPPIYERGRPQEAREHLRIWFEQRLLIAAMEIMLFGESYVSEPKLAGLAEITATTLIDEPEPAWLDRALRLNGFRT